MLQMNLLFRRGGFIQRYREFYECFSYMIRITHPYRDVIPDDLLKKARRWSWKSPCHTSATEGLNLWDEYAKSLAKKDLIKVR